MDTVYLYVKPSLVGTPEKYETVYESDGWRFWTPQQAIDWGWKTLDHDDFLVIGERNGEIVEIYHSDGEKRDHGEEDRQVTIQDILKSFGGELPENPNGCAPVAQEQE